MKAHDTWLYVGTFCGLIFAWLFIAGGAHYGGFGPLLILPALWLLYRRDFGEITKGDWDSALADLLEGNGS